MCFPFSVFAQQAVCDSACDEPNESCLNVIIGGPDGICAVLVPVNTPPYIVNLFPVCSSDCEPALIFADNMQVGDNEDGPSALIYGIVSAPPAVVFYLDDIPTQSFTQQQINDLRVSVSACESGPPEAFDFEVSDSQGMTIQEAGIIETDVCSGS